MKKTFLSLLFIPFLCLILSGCNDDDKNPLASCRGAYGLGLSHDGDLKGAIRRVAEQISETFPK